MSEEGKNLHIKGCFLEASQIIFTGKKTDVRGREESAHKKGSFWKLPKWFSEGKNVLEQFTCWLPKT
jgi:hypothetical protein